MKSEARWIAVAVLIFIVFVLVGGCVYFYGGDGDVPVQEAEYTTTEPVEQYDNKPVESTTGELPETSGYTEID